MAEPTKPMSAEIQCSCVPTRRGPARKIPRKAESAKNANTPSSARVWPMTPLASLDKAAQFVPNSIGMPVTTPTAKILAQNRAAVS
jgi:hypothetical protein